MRKVLLVIAIALAARGALAHGDFPPKRGGTSVWAGETTLEFVIGRGKVAVYLDDHGAPIAIKGAEGTLVVPSADGQERAVAMKVVGDAFEASLVPLKKGDKVKFFARMTDGNVH